jgi:hypothetical protein
MCEEFAEAETRLRLDHFAYFPWTPLSPESEIPGIPEDLVTQILTKLANVPHETPFRAPIPSPLASPTPKSNVGGFDPANGILVIRTATYDVYKCQGKDLSPVGKQFNDPFRCSTANADTDVITTFKHYPDCTHVVFWDKRLHYLNGDKIADAILVPGDPNCVTYAKVFHGLKINEFAPDGFAMTSVLRCLGLPKPSVNHLKSNVGGLDPTNSGICVHRTEKYEVYICECADFSPGKREFNNPFDNVTDNADTDVITAFKNYPECTHVVLWDRRLHYLTGDKIADGTLISKPNCVTYAKILLG